MRGVFSMDRSNTFAGINKVRKAYFNLIQGGGFGSVIKN